jgi:hypothetical protein
MSFVRTITDDVWIAIHQGRNYICTTADDEFTHAQLAYEFLIELHNKTYPDRPAIHAYQFDLLSERRPGVPYGRDELVGQIRRLLMVDSKTSEGPAGLEYAIIINQVPYYVLREGPEYSL